MAYKSRAEEREAIKKLRTGEVSSIPCYNCKEGKISSNPNLPIKFQNTFYCDKCNGKIIIN